METEIKLDTVVAVLNHPYVGPILMPARVLMSKEGLINHQMVFEKCNERAKISKSTIDYAPILLALNGETIKIKDYENNNLP